MQTFCYIINCWVDALHKLIGSVVWYFIINLWNPDISFNSIKKEHKCSSGTSPSGPILSSETPINPFDTHLMMVWPDKVVLYFFHFFNYIVCSFCFLYSLSWIFVSFSGIYPSSFFGCFIFYVLIFCSSIYFVVLALQSGKFSLTQEQGCCSSSFLMKKKVMMMLMMSWNNFDPVDPSVSEENERNSWM